MVPAILSNAFWIHSKEYKCFFMCVLSLQKSMQKHSDPSFFLTSTTTLHHGDWLGLISPESSISQSEAHISSKSGGGVHLNHSLNSSPSIMQISSFIALVQPSLFPSSTKMSWKAKMRSQAAAAFQGVQLLRPSKSSFSNIFFLSLSHRHGLPHGLCPRAASISEDSSTGGTGEAETTCATCTPFFRKIGDSDMFLTTTDTLLLLILSLVYVCKTCSLGSKGCTPPGWDSPALKGVTITWVLSPVSSLTLHSSIWV